MIQKEGNRFLLEERAAKKALIVNHRGASGGNIIENTISGFEASLLSGTDILEMDVFRTTDGELYIFHDGMEPRLFWKQQNVRTMTSVEVESLRFINQNSEVTNECPPSLDDVLEQFKGRCLINLDRCWWCWDSVFQCVRNHGMQEQILFKSPVKAEWLDVLAAEEIPFQYLPILRKPEELELADSYPVNTVGLEVIFADDGHLFASDAFIEEQHRKGRLLWANAIVLSDAKWMTGGHDDDHSILEDPNTGWGWLIDKGYDIIQTDWPWLLKAYLKALQ